MDFDGSPRPFEPGILRREAARYWWVPLIGGVVWFLIAWLVLRANYTSLTTVGVLLGAAFLVAAVNETALATVLRGGWRVWHIALAVVFVIGAVWGFARPIDTFFALASVLGLLLFLQGFLTLMRGIALRAETSYWWLDVVGGGLVTALGIWVSTSDRIWTLGARAAFILLWVGIMALFRGVSDLTVAFALRRFAHEDTLRWPGGVASPTDRPTPATGLP